LTRTLPEDTLVENDICIVELELQELHAGNLLTNHIKSAFWKVED